MTTSSGKKSPAMDLNLECHLNWISKDQASPAILSSTLEEREEKWIEMNGNPSSVSFVDKFAHCASQVVFAHWTDDTDSASVILEIMEELLQAETGRLKPEHLQAYQYLIEANRAVLAFRMGGSSNTYSKAALTKASLINIENPKTKALILSMKAGLIGFFGNTEGRVVRMRKVVELDPDVPEYLDAYFRAMRKLRREKNYTSPPSELEVEIMEKAFALAPKDPSVLQSMTTMYYDIVKKKSQDPRYSCKLIKKLGIRDLVSELKAFASRAAQASPESAAAGIQLAEILGCGPTGDKWDPESQKAAKDQYLRCVKVWPRDSNVLHKVGKYLTNTPEDFDMGLSLIALSLKSEHGNFPAFMDYLRLISPKKVHQDGGLDELLCRIDCRLPSFVKRTNMCSRIYCLKAVLLWKKQEFEEAVEFWLRAVEIDPDLFIRDTTALLGRGVFRGLLNGSEMQLQAYLVKLMNEPMTDANKIGLTKILSAVETCTIRVDEKPRNNAGTRQGTRPLAVSNVNAKADEDSNWRQKSSTETTTKKDEQKERVNVFLIPPELAALNWKSRCEELTNGRNKSEN